MVSGLRRMWRSERPVRTPVSAEDVGAHRGSFPAGTVVGAGVSVVGVVGLAGVADEGEEDVFEGGLLLDVLDLGRREERLEFGERAVLDDGALVQDRDPVGELFGLVEVLGREQHRGAAAGELLDGLPHLEARLGVEPRRRFVEEDDRRVADQAHRDVEPAAHAARVRRCLAVPRLGEREAGEQVVGDRARVLQVAQPGDQHQVLPAGEHLVDRGELAGQADRLAHVAGIRGDVEAVDRGGARVGLQQRREDPHQRGLAGAVRAEQREDAPRPHVEVDAPQHLQVLERLLDAPHPDRGFEGLVGSHVRFSVPGAFTPRRRAGRRTRWRTGRWRRSGACAPC